MSTPRLFRVIVPVADIDPAAEFYAELLGQPGMRVSGGRHYFRCGDVMLAVYSPKGDGDAREMRNTADGLGINGHGPFLGRRAGL